MTEETKEGETTIELAKVENVDKETNKEKKPQSKKIITNPLNIIIRYPNREITDQNEREKFSSDIEKNKNLIKSNPSDILYQALTNSIKNFSEINIKLKDNLEENLLKFKENINIWLKDIINEKQNFKKEISFILNKLNEKSSADVFEKKTNVEMPNTSKKDEAQKASMKQTSELKEIINELQSTNKKNYETIKKLNIEIKIKDEKISELNKLLNNK